MMSPTTFVAIVLAFWSSFHLAHSFLVNHATFGHNVMDFLLRYNIHISFFNVRWFTSRWNRFFIRVGRMWNWKLKLWFDAGIIIAVITMISGSILLCHTLFVAIDQIFFRPSKLAEEKQMLSVIVPGVNLPIRDIWYLLSAVFVSGILHEMGHAIAAAREGIQINGFGIFAFIIYPGAFVDLNSEDMNRSDPIAQLRVYCAGVWHNFMICLVVCIMILILPWLLFPFYAHSTSGVLVTYQLENSPLHGKMGFQVGDKIIQIDDCRLSNTTDWFYCINKTKRSSQWGSCVSLTTINNLSSHTAFTSLGSLPIPKLGAPATRPIWMDCCDKDAPQTHLCSEYDTIHAKNKVFACVPGRAVISHVDCTTNEDCIKPGGDSSDNVCVKAHTEPGSKFIRLVTLRKNTKEEKHNVLYIGDPNDVAHWVTVSDLLPRFPLLPLRLPNILLRFLQYMFSMSGALALLNIVPCYALDGQWAFKAILDFCNKGEYLTPRGKENISAVTLFMGTVLIAANILFGFVHLFTR